MNDRLIQDAPHGTIRSFRNGCETSAECDNFGTDRLTCIQVVGLNRTDPHYRQYLDLPGADGARGDWADHRRELLAAVPETPPPAEPPLSTAVVSDVVADDHPVDVVEPQPEEAPALASLPRTSPAGPEVDLTEYLAGTPLTDNAVIRAWAVEHGIDVNSRGSVRADVRAQYEAAMSTDTDADHPADDAAGSDENEWRDMLDAYPNPAVDAEAAKAAIRQEVQSADPMQMQLALERARREEAERVAADLQLHNKSLALSNVDLAGECAALRAANTEALAEVQRLGQDFETIAAEYKVIADTFSTLAADEVTADEEGPQEPMLATYLDVQSILDATASEIRAPITLGVGRLELHLHITHQAADATRDLRVTVKALEP